MQHIITHHKKRSHKKILRNLLDKSTEIQFAIGYLKNGGFKNIKEQLQNFVKRKNTKASFFIGFGKGVTESEALEKIQQLFNNTNNHRLHICNKYAGIFHPKVYLFKNNKEVTIIIGSANLTSYGLEINDELSIIINTDIYSNQYAELQEYFQSLENKYPDKQTDKLIAAYKKQLNKFLKKNNSQEFRFIPPKSKIKDIHFDIVKEYYSTYCNSEEFIIPSEREERYDKAKILLNSLCVENSKSLKEYTSIIGQLMGHANYIKLWSSGNIHRKTHDTLNYSSGFCKLVIVAKKRAEDITIRPERAFMDTLLDLNKLRKNGEIKGVGINILTEILMTFAPKRFANLNKNPLGTLTYFGKAFKDYNSFKESDYREYLELTEKIRKKLKMDSYLEIDSFFNFVYWE